MEQKHLAQVLHQMALTDQIDYIGRLFLAEARKETHTPNLTFQQIQQLWHTYYPQEDVDESCGVIRIYFDGKYTTQNIRKTREPVNLVICEVHADTSNEFTIEKYQDPEEFAANKPDEQNVVW